MNKLVLFKNLNHHRQLAERRALNFAQNKAAKYVLLFTSAMMIIYLVGFAITLATVANKSTSITSIQLLIGISPFILLLDFLLRFIAQQTPSQIIKPYVLMPISKYACIDTFIATSLFSWGNLIWFFTFIPYCLMAVVFSYGILPTISMLVFLWLLILANSQWYLIVRTLLIDNVLWVLLPIAVYALMAMPIYIGQESSIQHFLDLYASIGTEIGEGNILPIICALTLLSILILINRRMQYVHIWHELASTKKTKIHTTSQLSFLERFGEVGEYLRLELKVITRNKNPRTSFIFSTVIIILFSLLISFTTVYDNRFMTNFWCIYNFVIYGAMMLVKIMSNEGNYIDILMVHRQNILSLLHAKYIFYSVILIFPLILMLPTVFMGKWSILMLISYGVFTAGFQYYILFQMAVYNKQTTPLNSKIISRNGMNNYFQMVTSLIVFVVPMTVVSLLQTYFNRNVAYIIMLFIGFAFIATNKLWMRNIYTRMMKKKYENLESFHASR